MSDEVKLNPILMAIDFGYDVKKVAKEYVAELNKYNRVVIDRFKIIEPNQDWITKLIGKDANKYEKNANGTWTVTFPDGTVKVRRLFIIDPIKQHSIPEDLYKKRLKFHDQK